MKLHTNVNHVVFAALALLIVDTAPGRADMTLSSTKNAAYTSANGVALTTGNTTVATVTIAKGKKKRVLEIDAVVTETTNTINAIGLIARVNGFSPEPSAVTYQVKEGCSATNTNCTAHGRWWVDLDQAEMLNPGVYIGQPLNVTLQVSVTGVSGTGAATLQAKLVKP